jgi:hypothetical protein
MIVSGSQSFILISTKGFITCSCVNLIVSLMQAVSQKDGLPEEDLQEANPIVMEKVTITAAIAKKVFMRELSLIEVLFQGCGKNSYCKLLLIKIFCCTLKYIEALSS